MDDRVERIGIITDAHANFPATRAALAALDNAGCDLIIHTGDAIGIGPHPAEVLDLLIGRKDVMCLMGNHDELFAFDMLRQPPSYLGRGEILHQEWTHAQLPEEWRTLVANWPYSHELKVAGADLRFTHYARSNDRFCSISPANDSDELDILFNAGKDIVFFGHHHPRCDVQGDARYINPGALGTNPGEGARYALIHHRQNQMDITLHAVEYDAISVRRDLISKNVPEAEFILNVFLKN